MLLLRIVPKFYIILIFRLSCCCCCCCTHHCHLWSISDPEKLTITGNQLQLLLLRLLLLIYQELTIQSTNLNGLIQSGIHTSLMERQ